MGRNVTFKVTSVCGHVFSIDFEPKYNNWDTTDPAELFEAETRKDEANPKMRMAKHLKTESNECSELGKVLSFFFVFDFRPKISIFG